jgi:hypothetical protein
MLSTAATHSRHQPGDGRQGAWHHDRLIDLRVMAAVEELRKEESRRQDSAQ